MAQLQLHLKSGRTLKSCKPGTLCITCRQLHGPGSLHSAAPLFWAAPPRTVYCSHRLWGGAPRNVVRFSFSQTWEVYVLSLRGHPSPSWRKCFSLEEMSVQMHKGHKGLGLQMERSPQSLMSSHPQCHSKGLMHCEEQWGRDSLGQSFDNSRKLLNHQPGLRNASHAGYTLFPDL